jgi:hypothetical protein
MIGPCAPEVDCSHVKCEEPVICCAGTCADSYNPVPPPARSLEECCTCRGRAHVRDCPPSTHCFKDWKMSRTR